MEDDNVVCPWASSVPGVFAGDSEGTLATGAADVKGIPYLSAIFL